MINLISKSVCERNSLLEKAYETLHHRIISINFDPPERVFLSARPRNSELSRFAAPCWALAVWLCVAMASELPVISLLTNQLSCLNKLGKDCSLCTPYTANAAANPRAVSPRCSASARNRVRVPRVMGPYGD